ncbi:MAG: FtsX-like permease family protein [Bryobacteraceae bacterium]
MRALLQLFPRSDVTFYLDTSIDAGVLAFTAAVSVLTGLLFGLAPALQARKTNLVDSLKAGTQAPSGLANIWGQGLITGQVALSVVALVAAALFVRTLSNLRAEDAGFSRDHLLLASLDPSSKGWRGAQIADFYRRLLERVETLPEARGASLARVRVLAGVGVSDQVAIRGYQPVPQENMNVLLNAVSPGYFATLGIPLKAGRDFALTDRLDSPGVAIVNEAFVKRFFPNENPLGRKVSVGNPGDLDIVGVVRDSKYGGLDHPIDSTVYISVFQRPDAAWRSTLHIRFRGDTSVTTASVQALMRSIEPDLPLFAVRTMEAEVDNLLSRERMMALLSALFGALALLIAAIGIYGVLTFAILRRTKEIGIRMALGARPGQMVGQVVMESLRPVALGLVLGAAAALAVGRLSAGLLFGVSERDPAAFTLAAVTLLAAALLAAYLPARRAAKTDPMIALRQE